MDPVRSILFLCNVLVLRENLRITGTHCAPENGYVDCSRCDPCSQGHYSEEETYLDYCTPCSEGDAWNETGRDSACPECISGRIAADLNGLGVDSAGIICKACIEGRYSPSDGSTSCFDCGLGHFSLEAKSECSDCERGRFNNLAVASECESCDAGRFVICNLK